MNETVLACLTANEAKQIFSALDAAFRRNGRLPYELREFRAFCWHRSRIEDTPCGNQSQNTVSGGTSPPA
jgi:hypothetical protein